MLDFSFGELLLFAVIALVVLGPEKLPHAARMAGAWIGRIRRGMISIQSEIEREVAAQEMRERIEKEVQRVRDADRYVRDEVDEVSNSILNVRAEAAEALRTDVDAPAPVAEPSTTAPAAVPAPAAPEEKPGEEAFKAFVQSGQPAPVDKTP
jgi:sec-independent protein translocase protein TatB